MGVLLWGIEIIDGGILPLTNTQCKSAKPKDKMEEFLSQIISRLNDLFAGDDLSEGDMVNYARTIAGKVQEKSVEAVEQGVESVKESAQDVVPEAQEEDLMAKAKEKFKKMEGDSVSKFGENVDKVEKAAKDKAQDAAKAL